MIKNIMALMGLVTMVALAAPEIAMAKKARKKSSGGGGPYAGQVCNRGEKDDLKCMICTVMYEAGPNHVDRVAVTQVILKRMQTSGYPKTACGVVQAKGQFVVWNKHLKIRSADAAAVHKAVMEGRARGAGPYLGFRSYCRPGTGDTKLAAKGNCYRKKADLLDFKSYDLPIDFAELEDGVVDAYNAERIQTATIENTLNVRDIPGATAIN
ncbi:MAG TPA: cell wall hydrolase [Bdellovibrionales bacterium]|nr:cell wall hydrolase [Bdellovibrionales bacterium]